MTPCTWFLIAATTPAIGPIVAATSPNSWIVLSRRPTCSRASSLRSVIFAILRISAISLVYIVLCAVSWFICACTHLSDGVLSCCCVFMLAPSSRFCCTFSLYSTWLILSLWGSQIGFGLYAILKTSIDFVFCTILIYLC